MGIGLYGYWSVWVLVCVGIGLCGYWSVWVLVCVGIGLCGYWSVWVLICVGIGLCGYWSVWVLVCVGIGLCGYWSVWVLVCVGIGLCGYWSVWVFFQKISSLTSPDSFHTSKVSKNGIVPSASSSCVNLMLFVLSTLFRLLVSCCVIPVFITSSMSST